MLFDHIFNFISQGMKSLNTALLMKDMSKGEKKTSWDITTVEHHVDWCSLQNASEKLLKLELFQLLAVIL